MLFMALPDNRLAGLRAGGYNPALAFHRRFPRGA